MTSRQRIILLAIAAVVLVAGVIIASSSGDDDSGGTPTTAQTTATSSGDDSPGTTTDVPTVTVEKIRIEGGKPVGGAKTLTYNKGDTIALRFTSDDAGEVHIHGYDKELALKPGAAQVVRFKADLEGIYEVENHETDELLAKLEVRPK
ncbi:MAG TPA: hypothetical protein VF549_22015 [Solirubrobacteraceae bacterium]